MEKVQQEFTPTKKVLNIVEFDKNHQLWRICEKPNELFDYDQVQKVNIVEKLQEGKKTKSIIDNIGVTMGAPVSFAQPSAYVKIQIKVLLKNNENFIFDISDEYVKQNTLDYHDDKRKAEEIKKKLKILEKRNHQSKS